MRDDSLQIGYVLMYNIATKVCSKEYRVYRIVNEKIKVVYTGTQDMCKKFLRVSRKMERARKWKLIKKYAKIRFERFWDEWGITKQEMLDFLGAVSVIISIGLLFILAAILRVG